MDKNDLALYNAHMTQHGIWETRAVQLLKIVRDWFLKNIDRIPHWNRSLSPDDGSVYINAWLLQACIDADDVDVVDYRYNSEITLGPDAIFFTIYNLADSVCCRIPASFLTYNKPIEVKKALDAILQQCLKEEQEKNNAGT